MSENVVVLPGVERRDHVGSEVESKTVLQAAIEAGVTNVVLTGRTPDGAEYIASASQNIDEVVGILTRAAMIIAIGDYTADGE